MATLYWHDLNANGDATDRTNYSTDQAGTIAAAAGSMAADDLRFDGTGNGSDDDWVIGAGQTLTCRSIDAGGTAFTGSWTVNLTGTLTVEFNIQNLQGGTFTAVEGVVNCQSILNINKTLGNNSNRLTLNLISPLADQSDISFGTVTNTSFSVFANVDCTASTLFLINNANQPISGSNGIHRLLGTITGLPAVIVSGSGAFQFEPADSGRTSAIGSIAVDGAGLFIAQNANGGQVIQGIGGAGGEPSACTITLLGSGSTLRYGGGNNGGSEWGNPLVVDAGSSNAALLFQGFGNASGHNCYFPITLNNDLRIYRGGNAASLVNFYGPIGWAGTGTVDADAGKVTGTGQLTIDRPSGVAVNLECLWRLNSGALVSHSGGTIITSPTQSYRATAGYASADTAGSFAFGSGLITLIGNARFAFRGSTSDTFTVTNDFELSGAFTGDSDIPALDLGRISANPVVVFSGSISVGCPAWLVTTGGGGNQQQNRLDGPIDLAVSSRLVFSGSNGQDLVINNQITGVNGLSVKAITSGSDIKFAAVQATLSQLIAESGSGISIWTDTLTALKAVGTVEVLSGGRIRFDTAGQHELDGVFLARPGSIVSYTTGNSLLLSNVNEHEWSANLAIPDESRDFEVRLSTDGSSVVFNPSAPLPIPIFRLTGSTTFRTNNPGTTVIRPGQNAAATLPAGAIVMYLERGKSLTISDPLVLSMNQGDGQPTGAAGLATITGDGLVSFVQPDGWTPPPSYTQAEFDVDVAFAGSTPALSVLTVDGFVFNKLVRVENNSVNIVMNFSNIAVGLDLLCLTNTAGGSGSMTVNLGTGCTVTGSVQQQHNPAGTGVHTLNVTGALTVGQTFWLDKYMAYSIPGVLIATNVLAAAHDDVASKSVPVTGTVIVYNQLDLRPVAPNNPTYDVRFTTPGSGIVEYRPRGAGSARTIDLGPVAAGAPNMAIRLENIAHVEAAYDISFAAYTGTRIGSDILIRNESTDGLQVSLSGALEIMRFIAFDTEFVNPGTLTFDFNGSELRPTNLTMQSGTLTTGLVSASVVMVCAPPNCATIETDGVSLPDLFHNSALGLEFLSDVQALSYTQDNAMDGALDLNGFTLTGTNFISFLEGSVDSDGLAGATFITNYFETNGVSMIAASPWFVQSTLQPLAANALLQHSDNSASPTGNAVDAIDGGGNVNWTFNPPVAPSADTRSGALGLGLGLGFYSRK